MAQKPGQNRPNTILRAPRPLYTKLTFSNPTKYEAQSMLGGYVSNSSATTAKDIPRIAVIRQHFFMQLGNEQTADWTKWVTATFNVFRTVIGRNRAYTAKEFGKYLSEGATLRAFCNSLQNMVYMNEHEPLFIGAKFFDEGNYDLLVTYARQIKLLCNERYPIPKTLADWVDRYTAIGYDKAGEFYQDMYWVPTITGFSYGNQAVSEGTTGQKPLISVIELVLGHTDATRDQIASDMRQVAITKDIIDAYTVNIRDSILRNLNTNAGCTGQSAAYAGLTFAYSPSKDLANLVASEGSNDWNYYVKEKTTEVDILDIFYHELIDFDQGSGGDSNEYFAVVGTWQYTLFTTLKSGASADIIRQTVNIATTTADGITLAALAIANSDILGGVVMQIDTGKFLVAPCLPAFCEVIGSQQSTVHVDVWANAIMKLTEVEFAHVDNSQKPAK